MSEPDLRFSLSFEEAWELVGYLVTSRHPDLLEIALRLEDQVKRVERHQKLFEAAVDAIPARNRRRV